MARKLIVEIVGDTSSFDRAMGRTTSRSRELTKTLGKAGVAGAVVGLGAAIKIGFDEFNEAQKVTAQTNAVLKSTGGVANVTTKEVQNLSSALMRKSGVDDEAIQSGQNMLLTFTKIRNEVGEGNDIFDQATKATLNLSVAMGKDMQSSAILVGKALNDPLKGVTALSRAGVQFTADQKDMIKQMVAAGDTAGAQKLILKELETQFGGSAEAAGKTFGGQVNVAKESLKNLAGQGVAAAMPKLAEFSTWIRETGVPAIKSLWRWIDENLMPVFRSLAAVAGETWRAIAKVLKDNEKDIDRILGAAETLLKAIGVTAKWLATEVVIPILKPLFTTVLPVALNLTIDALAAMVKVIDGVKDGFVWLREKGGAAISTLRDTAKKPLNELKDAFDLWLTPIQKIIDGISWLIDNIKKIPKLPDIPLIGDARDPNMTAPHTGGLNLMGASPVMAPFAAGAAAFGLRVSSGLRPGAITANGTPSDHGIGKALDLAGSAAGMAAFFKSLIGNSMVKQAFYDPLGSIFGGAWNSYREGGHSDHVHVATYDKGGWLQPGWTMAYNGTGRPEAVGGMGGPQTIVVQLGDTTIARLVRNAKGKFEQQNGAGSF